MRILYATDGSAGALAAAQLLVLLPLETDSQLTILTVTQPTLMPPEEEAEGQEATKISQSILSHSRARLRTQVRQGNPAEEILQAAEEQSTDLIVVGSSGRSAIARFFVGSVAERVARHAACPVLMARPLHGSLSKLIVGVDGSPGAGRAVTWLQQFPLPAECEIRLLTVVSRVEDLVRTSRFFPLPLMAPGDAQTFVERQRREVQARLDELAVSLAPTARPVVTEIRRGDPATALLEVAEDEGADLIVVGKGHDSLERFLMGSVSEKVLRHAHCSVLIVRVPA
jgi:nucleotide-binding universal stress UspA family protein